MAEGDGVYELEELENHLQTLLSRYSSDDLRVDCRPFCSDFCKVVEEFAARWQVPLPQLRILKIALCFFAQASPAFTLNCDIVHQTISSLALSVFELLLFFDQKDLHQEPLKQFTVAFQECNLALARHQNVHLLQVERLICEGGPWACPLLKAILSDSSLPQNEVDGFISSELPVLFELRVRYLLSCERVSEAMALAKCCAWHPTAGQHLFFLQVYLSWLLKTSQHDILHKEVAGLDGKDAVYIICSLEYEEQDELLLALSRVFLSQQLCRGDMHCLCTFHHRLKTPKKVLLDEIHLLMQSATNVNSIFPFIKAVLQEAGDDGIQFCVELCANGLQSCLPCDIITKSLIYKTIASLLPNDLEVCRACALLVFFLERTVEAYKTAYLLYMHPDQDYHVDHSPIRNHIRFEMLQVLKKDLHFDPEFWNLIALRTNCLKLLSEKVVSSALEEIMEDKWILNYCSKETAPASSKPRCQKGNRGARSTQRRYRTGDRLKEDLAIPSKRLRLGPGKTLFNVDHISGDFIHEKRPNFLHKSHNSFIVAHAMFHFRKDECMFCGTMFKDDLLAMMHLSDHIEKLKKSKEFAGNKVQEKQKCAIGEGAKKQQGSLSSDQQTVMEMQHVPKTTSKHNSRVVQDKNVAPQQKVFCPVEGCTWALVLSKNRVALLYHALEEHCGDIRPLKLAFRIGNGKCSICMRVLWSFEHFQHHVERHRLTPRHPCLHQGCTERFKTGMEMRRHTRKHSPLQAVCCLPGCSKLFICLWALNLHEREHYSAKSVKPDKNSNKQTSDKSNIPSEKTQRDPCNGSDAVDEANTSASLERRYLSSSSRLSKSKRPTVESTHLNLVAAQMAEEGNVKDVDEQAENKDSTHKLSEYGKKPYKRLPPTAYLDERYTTMPKRRKEMTFSPSSERIPVKEEVGAPLQRQRCANCFVTFSSTDELQAHLQLQKCSNLFGFDSDDEGES
uniref:Uncharacterized LOC105416776 n=1 Tax=Takifugu rubripes TaxID=31033 RepID=H2UDI8_TAKRU